MREDSSEGEVRLIGVTLLNENPAIPSRYMVWPMMLDERDMRTPDDVRDEAEGLPGCWWFDEKLEQYEQVTACECCGQDLL
jgi:hypothetical protein